tara:strand:- start:5 stop:1588 length:1584 start_codon:yes stop_codon:yes gene_type:complete
MLLLRNLFILSLIFQSYIFSQNIDNNIEYFKLLFELEKSEKKPPLKIELPGPFKEFSSNIKTQLISFEKEFILPDSYYDYNDYKLFIGSGSDIIFDGAFADQIMFLVNNEFINNEIFNGQRGYEIDISKSYLKNGVNKISMLIINHSNEGRFNGDIYLSNEKEKFILNGTWNYYTYNKYQNNIIRKPTQGFDLLSLIEFDIDIDKYTSTIFNDRIWKKTNFPISFEKLFNDENINPAVCFRKLISFETIPSEDYFLEIDKGIDDYDRLYINGKLIGLTDCFNCKRKYLIPKHYLQKDNLFTLFVIDKDGPGGVKSKITLSNSTTSFNISDQWSYKKLLEMELLITVKNLDNKNSFYDNSEFSFYNLQGAKLNFDNLLIEDKTSFNYYFLFLILFGLLIIYIVYFLLKEKKMVEKNQKNDLIDEKEHIFIRSDRADYKILIDSIILIEGRKDYVKVGLEEKSYLVRKNLKTFLTELPTSKFVRISKSVALNKNQIEKIEKNMLFIKSGNYYIIGKKYNDGIKKLFSEN